MADSYALDTNVYIAALRDSSRLASLKRFLLRFGTRTHLHAVVAMELRTGVRSERHARALATLVAPYALRDLVIVPSFEAFLQAGRALAALSARERVDVSESALVADALLASSCREAGVVLVTENVRHFAALQRHVRGFRFRGMVDI